MNENNEKDTSGKFKEYGAVHSSSIQMKDLDSNMKSKPIKASFEEAIAMTGFGRFNYFLLLAAMPSCWAALFVPSTTAFVLPAAQCDLGLSLIDMGMLNASPFIGMIISAFFWGYLADTFGRKRLLIYGFIADGICNIICAFSINIWMLSFSKFCSGFIIAGPFAILMSYLSEFHSVKYRSKVFVVTGIYIGTVNFICPMLAWVIMPMNKLHIINYVISPWQIYVFICAFPSLIAGSCFTMLPESPKFLIITGKYTEALNVLKEMYSINYKTSPDIFPVSELIINLSVNKNEKEIIYNTSNKCTKLSALKKSWNQIKPLFFAPHFGPACLVLAMQFCSLLGSNTLKLWLPQIFTIIDDYEQINGNNSKSISVCEIISYLPKNNNITNIAPNSTCTGIISNNQVYINSGIVGVSSIAMFMIVAMLTNRVSSKTILGWMYVISGFCGLALIWVTNPTVILAFSSAYTAMSGVACVMLIGVVVDLFPTSLRTMVVSLNMTMGRIGTIIGNVIFPMLLLSGCLPPFLLIGGIILICLPLLFLLKPPTEENFQ